MISTALVLFFNVVFVNAEFLINTTQCQIPNLEAFSDEVKDIFKKLPHVQCSGSDLLTYTTVKDNKGYLHFKQDKIYQYYNSIEDFNCCVSYIFRNGSESYPDVGTRLTNCTKVTKFPLELQHDTVLINCTNYYNVHQVITIKEEVKPKLEQHQVRKLSVLFVVIDSVSRLNFIRTMPETRNFLIENDFLELKGYNKIDDNTFPNFNALLTGFNLQQSMKHCKPNMVGGLDNCSMIWYNFRNEGYVTAYGEDWADISTYVYLKKGFKESPTDYYFKPYFEVAERNALEIDTMPYCSGLEITGQRVLNLAKDFSLTFKPYPTFGIFWTNTFSHNYINTPSRMDLNLKSFFEDLKFEGILNETLIFLLSDHGMRFGQIRATLQGWHEERTPLNLISVPKWFKQLHPKKYENLVNNTMKLTSTYDVYMTLQEILALSSKNYRIKRSLACPGCRSLFSNIPTERSCRQAAIPETWCSCNGKFEANSGQITNELKLKLLKRVLDKYNANPLEAVNLKVLTEGLSKTVENKKYFLMVLQIDNLGIFQVLSRVYGEPLQLKKIVSIIKIY